MAKLHFKYGTVSSGKTLQLLVAANNYEVYGRRVMVLKPEIDTRFGYGTIKTRIGLDRTADLLLGDDPHMFDVPDNISAILVDEAQFLSAAWIDQLRAVSTAFDIPVLCFGLKADFKGHLFPGSKRLLEIADSIEEIKTVCRWCTKKATMNLKFVNGKPTVEGPSIELGAEEMYLPACWDCYFHAVQSQRQHG